MPASLPQLLTPFPGRELHTQNDTDVVRLTPVHELNEQQTPDQVAFLSAKYKGRLHAWVKDRAQGPAMVGGTESTVLQAKNENHIFKVRRAPARREDVQVQRERWARVNEYFGDSSNIIVPRHHWWFVPQEEAGDIPEHQRGVLSQQQQVIPEISKGYHLQLQKEYLERSMEPFSAQYIDLNERYVSLKKNAEPGLLSSPTEGMTQVIHEMQRNPSLRTSMEDFVRRSIRFCSDTGELLDFAGSDNISVVWRNNRAQIALVDPLFPARDGVRGLQDALHNYFAHDICRKPNAARIKNGLLCTRTLNWLAESLEMDDRLDICMVNGERDARIQREVRGMPWSILGVRIQSHEEQK
jgi:hypothetical protein